MWPKQSECDVFYGNPRGKVGGTASGFWERENLVLVDKLPFLVRYAGQPVRGLRLHRKCADAYRAWMEAVWRNASRDQRVIDAWGMGTYGGGYNFRLMRGLNSLSMHSYGCAVDFDPARNALADSTPHFATLRKEVVDPFIKLGGVWGGDWNGNGISSDERRCDGMHFQFARL